MKKFIKLIICSFIFLLISTFNEPHSEPLYYEIDFNDGVIHLWSRKVMYNYNNCVTNALKRVDLKYGNKDHEEIQFRAAFQSYKNWEQKFKFENYVD